MAFPPWVFQEAFALNLSHKTSAARGVDVVGLVDYRVPGHVWQILVNQWLVSEALVAQHWSFLFLHGKMDLPAQRHAFEKDIYELL